MPLGPGRQRAAGRRTMWAGIDTPSRKETDREEGAGESFVRHCRGVCSRVHENFLLSSFTEETRRETQRRAGCGRNGTGLRVGAGALCTLKFILVGRYREGKRDEELASRLEGVERQDPRVPHVSTA